MRSLKEKLDGKNNERATTGYGEIFTIITQVGIRNLIGNRKFEEKE